MRASRLPPAGHSRPDAEPGPYAVGATDLCQRHGDHVAVGGLSGVLEPVGPTSVAGKGRRREGQPDVPARRRRARR